VTGPGGAGKTRVAVELARRLVVDHPDGVWLVELAALGDPGLVGEVVWPVPPLGVPVDPGPAGPGGSMGPSRHRLRPRRRLPRGLRP
jgi:predicted ATPase